ncbi:MAG TPA: prepilin-type N-terminal cleavage/methylation domain-containing protein [Terriglobales bacterium]|nr:prepilin-type N-terminal cleavage/methylation domain-containing protein [Terriglobales bacterium]
MSKPSTTIGRQRGLTLLELLVSIAISMIVLAAAFRVVSFSMQSSTLVMQRGEMQSELRSAANQIVRDLQQAGTGMPTGGIPLPSQASGGTNPVFGCDSTTCYLTTNNKFTQGVFYKVTPGHDAGPTTLETTDAIVLAFKDPTLNWTAYTTTALTDAGDQLTMPASTTPAVNDVAVGITVGDVLLLTNSLGSALGVVTGVNGSTRVISFANLDPLNINQSGAPVGNIKSLRYNPIPGSGPHYPAVTVSRITMITYFLQSVSTTNGPDVRLMRQVGAHKPVPVAEHIDDLQFTYDVFDDTTSTLTANLPDAATGSPATPKPNQIRKINMTITARALRPNNKGLFDRIAYSTSVGPRNLAYHDRYN